MNFTQRGIIPVRRDSISIFCGGPVWHLCIRCCSKCQLLSVVVVLFRAKISYKKKKDKKKRKVLKTGSVDR